MAFVGAAGALHAAEVAKNPNSTKEKLIVAWHMVSMEEQGPDGKATHHTDRKSMVYTRNGHMSVQVMYPQTESAASSNPVYAQSGYEASFGSHDVDEQTHTATHHVEGSLVRALVGKNLLRLYQFSTEGG